MSNGGGGGGSVWVAAKAVSHEDGGWTVDTVSGLRDELAGEGRGRARKRGV